MLQQRRTLQQGWTPPRPGSKQIQSEDVDFSKYATPLSPAAQVTLGNVISPEDYARAQALSKLTQRQASLPIIDPSRMGVDPNIIDFRAQDLKTYLAKQQQKILDAQKGFQTGLGPLPVYPPDSGRIGVPTPVTRQPQVNPGINPGVPPVRAFSYGGEVEPVTLQNYFKQKRGNQYGSI